MQKDNDYELLYFIHTNDENAYRYLYRKYRGSIYYIAKKYLKKKDYCDYIDEFIQIARIKLLDAVYSYREDKEASFSNYFFAIFKRSIIDGYRNLYCRRKGSGTWIALTSDSAVCEQQAMYLVDLSESERYHALCERIDVNKQKLKPLERKIIDLRVEGYSYTQIADDLHIKAKKVDNTLQKIRKTK